MPFASTMRNECTWSRPDPWDCVIIPHEDDWRWPPIPTFEQPPCGTERRYLRLNLAKFSKLIPGPLVRREGRWRFVAARAGDR